MSQTSESSDAVEAFGVTSVREDVQASNQLTQAVAGTEALNWHDIWFGQSVKRVSATATNSVTAQYEFIFEQAQYHRAAADLNLKQVFGQLCVRLGIGLDMVVKSIGADKRFTYAVSGGESLSRPWIDELSLPKRSGETRGTLNPTDFAKLDGDLFLLLGKLAKYDPSSIDVFAQFRFPNLDDVYADQLGLWSEIYRETAFFHDPVAEGALRLLNQTIPKPPRSLALVHGLCACGGAVVDTVVGTIRLVNGYFAHIGHPLEDLAWALSDSMRLGGDMAGRARLQTAEAIALWQMESGREVNMNALLWWQVFASFKAITLAQEQMALGVANESGLSPAKATWALHTITIERASLTKRLPELMALTWEKNK